MSESSLDRRFSSAAARALQALRRRLLRGELGLHAGLLMAVLVIVATDLRGQLGAILFVAFLAVHTLASRGERASVRRRPPACEGTR